MIPYRLSAVAVVLSHSRTIAVSSARLINPVSAVMLPENVPCLVEAS